MNHFLKFILIFIVKGFNFSFKFFQKLSLFFMKFFLPNMKKLLSFILVNLLRRDGRVV